MICGIIVTPIASQYVEAPQGWVARPTCRLGRVATRCLPIDASSLSIRTPMKRLLVPLAPGQSGRATLRSIDSFLPLPANDLTSQAAFDRGEGRGEGPGCSPKWMFGLPRSKMVNERVLCSLSMLHNPDAQSSFRATQSKERLGRTGITNTGEQPLVQRHTGRLQSQPTDATGASQRTQESGGLLLGWGRWG